MVFNSLIKIIMGKYLLPVSGGIMCSYYWCLIIWYLDAEVEICCKRTLKVGYFDSDYVVLILAYVSTIKNILLRRYPDVGNVSDIVM